MVGKRGKLPEGAPISRGPILNPFPANPLPTVMPPIFAPLKDGNDEDDDDPVATKEALVNKMTDFQPITCKSRKSKYTTYLIHKKGKRDKEDWHTTCMVKMQQACTSLMLMMQHKKIQDRMTE
jgi:hypothetical protein